MNQRMLLNSWATRKRKAGSASALHIVGNEIHSYNTTIAVLYRKHAIVSSKKSSQTTSCHQGKVRNALARAKIETYIVPSIVQHRESACLAGLREETPPPIISDKLEDLR